MFSEYRELISMLRGKHRRFDMLCEKHDKFEYEIKRLEKSACPAYSMQVVKLKLDKLEVKREIQKILEEESGRF